ncbi:phosphodiester glycosidase family protein [Sphingobacterium faecale]|uniref:Phosphodiester glycosidase family protein n=1 Tax=Sphingobacterium faecale TaxID=2803775 RepID=A0ABS1R0N4_9SPHI|nr:phosphodiester glycosidase family protein [Sphingobacterium faecale]MBL1408259.1 phosphodiester glycosidase family protein [Sphingobacterium faecale]
MSRLKNLIWLSAIFIFNACQENDVLPPVPKPTEVEKQVDADREKYGKPLQIGKQIHPVQALRKEAVTDYMDYFKITVNNAGTDSQSGLKLQAHVIRLDRKGLSDGLRIESLLAGSSLDKRGTPLDIMNYHTSPKKTVLASLNGDFFVMETGGTILGAMVSEGRLLKTANSDWKLVYGTTSDGQLFIDELDYTITLGDDKYPINGINGSRQADQLILYTGAKGERTGTNIYGSEIVLKPVSGDWETAKSHESVLCEVTSDRPVALAGGLVIPKGHVVLSGHGAGITICNRYKKGDRVFININKPVGKKTEKVYDVQEAIGASYILLKSGQKLQITSTSGNPHGKEPRTAVGHSDKYFYMVVVEGRSDVSDGLKSSDLADLLLHFEITDAVNLDGGGSSMLALGNTIYGQPEGTTWFRPVANALTIVRKK